MVLKLILVVLLLASLGHVSCAGKETKALPAGTKEKVAATLDVMNKAFSGVNEIIQQTDKAKLLESFIKISGSIPIYGSLVAAVINCVMLFIPMEDPVIEAMKKSFNEVNRKLDSMALEISLMTTEVQWASYASIYSQDESNIHNSWDKYLEFLESSIEAQTEEEKMRMGERFTTFYEGTATESSVASLYSYLTITQPSLKLNLLEIVVKKLKGDVELVIKHSLYFRNLLFTGYQMNLVYYTLKGFKTDSLVKRATIDFQTASEAIQNAVQNCFNHSKTYMMEDVKVIGTAQSLDYSQLAKEIKKFLDKKYNWYDWIVVGFWTKDKSFQFSSSFSKFEFGEISVAVSHSLKGPQNDMREKDLEFTINKCMTDITCSKENIVNAINECIKHGKNKHFGTPTDFEKAVAGFYFFEKKSSNFEIPEPFLKVKCKKGKGNISIFSQSEENVKPPACPNCMPGICTQLLDTTVRVCKCNNNFYGPQCEKNIMKEIEKDQVIQPIDHPVPDLSMIYLFLNASKKP